MKKKYVLEIFKVFKTLLIVNIFYCYHVMLATKPKAYPTLFVSIICKVKLLKIRLKIVVKAKKNRQESLKKK